jgi:hypothetical protein
MSGLPGGAQQCFHLANILYGQRIGPYRVAPHGQGREARQIVRCYPGIP